MSNDDFIEKLRKCENVGTIGKLKSYKLIRSKIKSIFGDNAQDEFNDLIELVKQSGIDVNSFHDDKYILLTAIQDQRIRVVEFLLAVGANTESTLVTAIHYCYRGAINSSKKILQMLLNHGVECLERDIHVAYMDKKQRHSTDIEVLKILIDSSHYDVHKCWRTFEKSISDNDYLVFSMFINYGFSFNEPFGHREQVITYLNHFLKEPHLKERMIKKLFSYPNLELNGNYYYFKDNDSLSLYQEPIAKLLHLDVYEVTADLFFDKFMKYIVYNGMFEPVSLDKMIKVNKNEHYDKLIARLHDHERTCIEKIIDATGNKNVSALIYDYCC